MKNFVSHGDNVTVTAPAAVSSGELVIVGALAGVAVADAANGAPVALVTEGVFTLPKLNTAVFVQGGKVSYDTSTKQCVAAGTGKYPIGVAIEAAGNGATTVNVRLDGVSTAAA